MKILEQRWYHVLFRRRIIISLLLILQVAFLAYLIVDINKYSTYINLILRVLSFLVALRVIAKPGSGAYKMSWVFLILDLPLFGGLFYILVTQQTSTKMFVRKMDEIGQKSKPLFELSSPCNEKAENEFPLYTRQLRYLKQKGFPAYKNVCSKYLTPGEEKLKFLLEELKKAEKYIFLEYFIIQEGKMWNTILSILERKAKEGVKVRIIYDDMGCFFILPKGYSKKLESLGIECVVFNPFRPFLSTIQNNRDHRKIAVIDGKVAFTGGINLADEYINVIEKHGHWKDCGILVTGKAAWGLTVIFLQMWELCKNTKEDYSLYYPGDNFENKTGGYIIPYSDSPLDNENVGEHVYLHIINNAKKYVYINTPYLIIDSSSVSALCLAAKSGVDVRIVTPHKWDKRIVHMTTRSYYRELIDAGVKIYEYTNGFIHSKTFVSDDYAATVGTANLDFRSLYLQFECGLLMYNTPAVMQVKEDFLETLKVCQPITREDCRCTLITRFFQDILRLIAPLM